MLFSLVIRADSLQGCRPDSAPVGWDQILDIEGHVMAVECVDFLC